MKGSGKRKVLQSYKEKTVFAQSNGAQFIKALSERPKENYYFANLADYWERRIAGGGENSQGKNERKAADPLREVGLFLRAEGRDRTASP